MGNNPFPAAAGYGQFPNGNWSKITFSNDLIMFNRTISVVEEITNNDYLADGPVGMGSEIEIMKEPEITVTPYARGKRLTPQRIDDDKVVLTISEANSFAFEMDDIEKALGHVDWAPKLMNAGVYALRNNYDTAVLSYIVSNASTNASTTGVSIGFGSGLTTPLNYLGTCRRVLDENNVAEAGRYAVCSPRFFEYMEDEDSSLTDISYTGDTEFNALRATKFGANRVVKGFVLYKSNNLPANTDIIYGNVNAVAAVQAIDKTKVADIPDGFGQMFAGLHVFGRQVIKDESVFYGTVTFG